MLIRRGVPNPGPEIHHKLYLMHLMQHRLFTHLIDTQKLKKSFPTCRKYMIKKYIVYLCIL